MPTNGVTKRRPAAKRAAVPKQTRCNQTHTGKRVGELKARSIAKSSRVEQRSDDEDSKDETTLIINQRNVNKYSDSEDSDDDGRRDEELNRLKAENETLVRQAFSTRLAMPTITVYVKQLSESQKSALTTHVRKEIFKSVKCVWQNTYNDVVKSCCDELCIPIKERHTYTIVQY